MVRSSPLPLPGAPAPMPRTPDDSSTIAALRIEDIPSATYALTVVEGPDVGLTFSVDASRPQRVLAGTSAACDLRLTDRKVSRRHLALEIVGRTLRIADLDS